MIKIIVMMIKIYSLKISVVVKIQYKIILLLLGVYKHIRLNLSSHEVSSGIRRKYSFYKIIILYYFLSSDLYSFLFNNKLAFISFLFVWVRGTTPRFPYDKLMYLAWRRFLPLSLNYLLCFVGVRCFIFSLL